MGLPVPAPGLVINFAYLWRHEFEAGAEEGRKVRPVLILAVGTAAVGSKRVTVVPLTHSEPSPGRGILVPRRVKEHLGLDAEASWIVIDDLNVFEWPGYDLVPIPGSAGTYAYGFIPARLFIAVRNAVAAKLPPPVPTPRS